MIVLSVVINYSKVDLKYVLLVLSHESNLFLSNCDILKYTTHCNTSVLDLVQMQHLLDNMALLLFY